MFKPILLILISTSLCAGNIENKKNVQNESYSIGRIMLWCGLAAGGVTVAVTCVPMVLSAGTIVAIKAGAVAAASKVVAAGVVAKQGVLVAAPIAAKVNLAVWVAQTGKALVYSSPEQKLAKLQQEEKADLVKAARELENCLIKSDINAKKNHLNIPFACEEVAMFYTLCKHGTVS